MAQTTHEVTASHIRAGNRVIAEIQRRDDGAYTVVVEHPLEARQSVRLTAATWDEADTIATDLAGHAEAARDERRAAVAKFDDAVAKYGGK